MSYIGVVIATYNSAEYLVRCLGSVLEQTYDEVDIYIQDGGSSDQTVDLIKEYESSLTYWASEPESGRYDAWNKALSQAESEWFVFLGSDDYLWGPDTLERMVPILEGAYPDNRVVYGSVNRVRKDGTVIQTEGQDWAWAQKRFYDRMSLPHQGVFHHRSLFEKHGMFDVAYQIVGDHELLLRELRHRDPLFVPHVVVSGMQVGGVSLQTSRSIERWLEYRRSQLKHDISGFRWRWWFGYSRAKVRRWTEKFLGESAANRLADFYRSLIGLPRFWTLRS